MAQNKTVENDNSVEDFINSVADARKQADTRKILEIFRQQTGCESKMWGTAIIGFGSCHYKYASGREGDMPMAGFSPRKNYIAPYLETNFENRDAMLARLGKHTTSKACIYVKKLNDIDAGVLKDMIEASVKRSQTIYPQS